MGWFGPQSGSCGCCGGFTCESCNVLTYVTISGMTNANCPTGCDDRNGTYFFRDGILVSDCSWVLRPWSETNCGADDDPALYVYGNTSSRQWGLAVEFRDDPGGVLVIVDLFVDYDVSYFTPFPGTFYKAFYRTRWTKVAANCSALVGSLTRTLTTSGLASGSAGLTGDVCGVHSANCVIG